jgi:hypothetical protein
MVWSSTTQAAATCEAESAAGMPFCSAGLVILLLCTCRHCALGLPHGVVATSVILLACAAPFPGAGCMPFAAGLLSHTQREPAVATLLAVWAAALCCAVGTGIRQPAHPESARVVVVLALLPCLCMACSAMLPGPCCTALGWAATHRVAVWGCQLGLTQRQLHPGHSGVRVSAGQQGSHASQGHLQHTWPSKAAHQDAARLLDRLDPLQMQGAMSTCWSTPYCALRSTLNRGCG